MQGPYLRKYGAATTIPFRLFEVDGVDFRTDGGLANGDIRIMKDEGSDASSPAATAVDRGLGYSIALTDTELEAARIVLYIIDLTATKVWLDTTIIIETYGNANAQHPVFDANLLQINGATTPVDNLEAQYDTTGLTGDTFPATQAQLDQIANVGSAINTPAKNEPDGFVITHGENEVNDEDATHALDGDYHTIQAVDDGGTEKLDVYYEFNVGSDGVPSSVTFSGRMLQVGAPKNLTVHAWNWTTSAWRQIGILSSSVTDGVESYGLFTAEVGTGHDLGKVRIRFLTGDVPLSATSALYTDQIFVSYSVVSRTIGYANGGIWVDTLGSNTGVVPHFDGVADNPVSTWAAALNLGAALNIRRFIFKNGSSIALTDNSDHYELLGEVWTLALAGQSADGLAVSGAMVSGIATNGSLELVFNHCHIGDVTLPPSHLTGCGLGGKFTAGSAGDFFFDRCHSSVAGLATPTFDWGAGLDASSLNFRGYSGGIELEYMGAGAGNYNMSLEGHGQYIINANCTGGLIARRGHWEETDDASGAVAVESEACYSQTIVKAIADAALTDYAGPTKDEMDTAHALLATAANLALVDTVVNAIKAVTDNLPDSGALNDLAALAARLTAARAGYLDNLNVGGDVASNAQVAALNNVSTGNLTTAAEAAKLASDGLDAIPFVEPTGAPPDFLKPMLEWLIQLNRRATMTPTALTVKKDDDTLVTTQVISDDGTTQELGAPS